MKNLLRWGCVLVVSFAISGCGGGGGGDAAAAGGGGGGGGGTAPATLTGAVTDTVLAPVAGATVTAGTTSTTTDAVGRYTIGGLSPSTTLTLTVHTADSQYADGAGKVVLAAGQTTVFDLSLPRANDQPVLAADVSGGTTVTSDTFIDAVKKAQLVLGAGNLTDSAGTYAGDATVYLTPIDVAKPGHGLANYQATLDTVFASLSSDATLIEPLASASVYVDGGGNALGFSSPNPTVVMPIPVGLQSLSLPDPANLWYLDASTGTWVKDLVNQATLDSGAWTYTGIISRPGVWIAGAERLPSVLTIITGSLKFSNGAAAAGASIYLVGADNGLHGVTFTDSSGNFSISGKTGGSYTAHAVVWGNGAQLPHSVSITGLGAGNATLGNVALPFAPPSGSVATGVAFLDTVPSNDDPQTLGYIFASGRQIRDDDLASQNVADVTFLASASGVNGVITMTPTDAGSSIQIVSGSSFEALTTFPGGTFYDKTAAVADYTVQNLETAALPILVAVQTAQGHYAKISIDSVTVDPLVTTKWKVVFRHAFSLTGTF